MTITLPTWYLTGCIVSFILAILKFAYIGIRAGKIPFRLKDMPGIVILLLFDALLSWFTFAIGLCHLFSKKTEMEEVIRDLKMR